MTLHSNLATWASAASLDKIEKLQQAAAAAESMGGHHYLRVLLRLAVAFGLALVVAYRPWRWIMRKPQVRAETAHAQVLIAVAGAIVVAIVGDNLARAFGLVGLGGFVRFRSPIKDPRDAAVMFLMIGVGMATGLGALTVAAVCTGFICLVLVLFDALSAARPPRLKVTFVTDDARALLPLLRQAHPNARVLSAPNAAAAAAGAAPVVQKLVLEMDVPDRVDAATILAGLPDPTAKSVREVTINED
jgi:hypothetical protein